MLTQVAGLHRAGPSTTLDKRYSIIFTDIIIAYLFPFCKSFLQVLRNSAFFPFDLASMRVDMSKLTVHSHLDIHFPVCYTDINSISGGDIYETTRRQRSWSSF